MRLGRKTRTGLGLSLGVLAGIAMILLPGLLTVTQAPLPSPHGLANGNNTHSGNSTITTSRTANNSTGAATTGPTAVHTTNSNATAVDIAAVNLTATGSTTKNPPPGSLPATTPVSIEQSSITGVPVAMLVSTIIVPALGLSLVARSWSIRQAKKSLEEHLEL